MFAKQQFAGSDVSLCVRFAHVVHVDPALLQVLSGLPLRWTQSGVDQQFHEWQPCTFGAQQEARWRAQVGFKQRLTVARNGRYEPDDPRKPAHIPVWMRTAARKDVVAFKTFLRTLIHELCHHLDYELHELSETFHTEGFYKRESALTSALLRAEQDTRPAESTPGDLPG